MKPQQKRILEKVFIKGNVNDIIECLKIFGYNTTIITNKLIDNFELDQEYILKSKSNNIKNYIKDILNSI